MIELYCGCKQPRRVPEDGTGRAYPCSQCGQVVYPISAETLGDGNGVGDFDATLQVVEGPAYAGETIQLGGVLDIEFGKSSDRHVCLPGKLVSRSHAKLTRVDFGPSRWKIVDNKSTNGLFVNDVRVAEQELQDGDIVRIGEFQLRFGHVAAKAAPVAAAAQHAGDGLPCPSCEKVLGKKAKICVECGININTGRPILTRQGVDENALYAGAESIIRWISLLVWITPFPIPIRSEAFGTRKPYAIWTIAVATILASITFFIAQHSNDRGQAAAGTELMLWAPQEDGVKADAIPALPDAQIRKLARELDADDRADLRREFAKPGEKVSDEVLLSRAIADALHEQAANRGQFQWYQLITHAFLHDTSSIYNFLMHLGGNLVFMLCFGTRVNALIGNIATAVLYPILAISAATIHLMSLGHGIHGPMLGASGAIMGLAGMYLVLFPIHQVYCAMWISIWLRFRRIFGCKIFSLRGFWILLIYIGWDVAMSYVDARFGVSGGVAHWAHIGGFVTGVVLGLSVLLSRLFDTHGGDMLSVALGRYAWPIIGKPGRTRRAAAQVGMPAYA
jgi:membrane associated rhomboid family serine protease